METFHYLTRKKFEAIANTICKHVAQRTQIKAGGELTIALSKLFDFSIPVTIEVSSSY